MIMYVLRRWQACLRKRAALGEIRRNGWRSPWLGDGRRSLRWRQDAASEERNNNLQGARLL